MKIKAREGGSIVDIGDEGGRTLVDAGIYDVVATEKPTPKAPTKTPPAQPAPTPKAPEPSRSPVAPMGTGDMPTTPVKPAK